MEVPAPVFSFPALGPSLYQQPESQQPESQRGGQSGLHPLLPVSGVGEEFHVDRKTGHQLVGGLSEDEAGNFS